VGGKPNDNQIGTPPAAGARAAGARPEVAGGGASSAWGRRARSKRGRPPKGGATEAIRPKTITNMSSTSTSKNKHKNAFRSQGPSRAASGGLEVPPRAASGGKQGNAIKQGSRISIQVILFQGAEAPGAGGGLPTVQGNTHKASTRRCNDGVKAANQRYSERGPNRPAFVGQGQTIYGICVKRTNRGTSSTIKIKHLVNNVPVIQTFPLYSPFIVRVQDAT
jgi:hypothetical protein